MSISSTRLSSILLCLGTKFSAISSARAADEVIHAKFTICAIAVCDNLATLQIPLPGPSKAASQPWLEVPLNELSTSETFDYKGPPTVRFFATTDTTAKPVAAVTLPTGAASLLLVLLPNATNDGYRVIVVPDSDFAFGSYYLQNLSSFPVAVDLGGKKQALPPGAKAVMPGGGGKDLDIKIHASINGRTRLIRSTSWRIDSNQRELIFFHSPPGTDRVMTKHIVSTKPEQKEAKP